MLVKPQYVIGLDIGGTYTRAVLVRNQRVVKRLLVPTPRRLQGFVALVPRLIQSLIPVHSPVSSIGIAVAGVVSHTRVVRSRNISYLKAFDFKLVVPAGMKLKVDNDARSYLRGVLKAKPSQGRVLCLALGTGIGRAFATHGRVSKLRGFEQHEAWEHAYQVRRFKPNLVFTRFVVHNLMSLFFRYRPTIIILGGGVVERKIGFAAALTRQLKLHGVSAKVMRAPASPFTAALGAALLVSAGRTR